MTSASCTRNHKMVLDVAHLVAGVSGGVASTLVLHPLDLVKIRMQGLFKNILVFTSV